MVQNLIVGPLGGVFLLVTLAIYAVKIFALVDALIRPQAAWRAAVEQPKALWIGILLLSLIFGGLGFLGLIALVATIYYLVDVRPKLLTAQGRGRARY